MRFVNFARYVKDQQKLADLQPQHTRYLATLLAEGKLAAAGSFADGTGELQVYETDSAETARAVAAAEPLAAGGAVADSELATHAAGADSVRR
jgi:uncharacterized protein